MEQSAPQYSQNSIARYEAIFGRDFVSTGGLETTKKRVGTLGLRPGMRVLDAGCGLGGSAFYMARTCGVEVLGIDLLPQMIKEARRRAAEYGLAGLEFLQGDLLQIALPQDHFDFVYSRDAFLHIAGNAELFQRLRACLRPGGTLFFTDYARGPAPGSNAFEAYRIENGYDLHEVRAYGALVAAAGFPPVDAVDRTAEFVHVLQREMTSIKSAGRPERLSEADRHYLLDRWAMKVQFCLDGDMRWCSVMARRPV